MAKLAYFLVACIAIVVILIFGQNLLIPFLFAILLWFTVKELKGFLNKIPVFEKRIPSWIKTTITSILLLVILIFGSAVITSNIEELARSYKQYENNADGLLKQFNELFDIDLISLMKDQNFDFNFGEVLTAIFNSLSNILGNSFMIVLYALFMLMEESLFVFKLKKLFKNQEQFERVMEVLDTIEDSVAKYLGLKTIVSLITGVLSYLVLAIIGVNSPVFWAFLIFLMNFIPTIGSLIGTLFPAIFCLLQFGDFTTGLIVLGVLGLIQVLVGNILEPKIMGNSLNVSALVTILALSFWGAIWGVTGMILSVPITVIMIIVFSQFESTIGIAIMLSEKGRVRQNKVD